MHNHKQEMPPREQLGAILNEVLFRDPENKLALTLQAKLRELSEEKILAVLGACDEIWPRREPLTQVPSPTSVTTGAQSDEGVSSADLIIQSPPEKRSDDQRGYKGAIVPYTQAKSAGGPNSDSSGQPAPSTGLDHEEIKDADFTIRPEHTGERSQTTTGAESLDVRKTSRQRDTEEKARLRTIEKELEGIIRQTTGANEAVGKFVSNENIDRWIELGLERLQLPVKLGANTDPQNVIDRFVRIGLVSEEVAKKFGVDNPPKEHDENCLRNLSRTGIAAWITTTAIFAGGLGVNWAAGMGHESSLVTWVMAGATWLNYMCQSYLSLQYRNFRKIFTELIAETGGVTAERDIAAHGMMYKLIQRFNPLIVQKDRTDVTDGAYPSSRQAILQHLRDAALGGCTDTLLEGQRYQEKVKSFRDNLKALIARWDWQWDSSMQAAGVLAAGSVPIVLFL